MSWYRMHRGWQDDPLFAGEPYSRRDAFEWLIANAAWEPTETWFKGCRVSLQRGSLVASERDLAAAWRWDRQRVRTFLNALETDGKIARKSNPTDNPPETQRLTQSLTQRATQLTICNYEKYQAGQPTGKPGEEPSDASETNPADEPQHKNIRTEEDKNLVGGEPPSYAFFGKTVRLTPRDFSEWKRLFHTIFDLEAELSVLDGWWQTQPESKRKSWFHATKAMLNKKHQSNLAIRNEAATGAVWDGMP